MQTIMATYEILRIGGSTSSVSIAKLDESTFVSREIGNNGSGDNDGSLVSAYTVATGDDSYPTLVRVYFRNNPKGYGGHGQTTFTIQLNSWIHEVDDAGLSKLVQIQSSITVNKEGGAQYEIADLRLLLQNLYALTYSSVAAGVEDNTRLTKLMFGGTKIAAG